MFNIYYFFHFSEFHFSNYFVSKFLVKLQTLHWVVNLELSFILWIEKMLQIIVFFKRKSLMGWQQNTFCHQHQAILEYIKVQPFLTSDQESPGNRFKLSPFLRVSADSCEGLQIFGWFMEIITQTRRNLTQKFWI